MKWTWLNERTVDTKLVYTHVYTATFFVFFSFPQKCYFSPLMDDVIIALSYIVILILFQYIICSNNKWINALKKTLTWPDSWGSQTPSLQVQSPASTQLASPQNLHRPLPPHLSCFHQCTGSNCRRHACLEFSHCWERQNWDRTAGPSPILQTHSTSGCDSLSQCFCFKSTQKEKESTDASEIKTHEIVTTQPCYFCHIPIINPFKC